MADDIDAMLNGQDQDLASQAQTNDQVEVQKGLSDEEVEFNRLSGSTQARIKRLIQDKREALDKASRYESQIGSVPPPAPSANFQSPEVQNAVRQLDQVGVATKDFVREELNSNLAQLRYDEEMRRLHSEYGGTKGEPQFVREEYEEYVNSHPQYRNYLPEDVFKDKMFRDEFLNMQMSGTSQKTSSTTLKPSRTSMQKEALTPESLEQKLQSLPPTQRATWLNDHQEEVNEMTSRMAQG